MIGIKTIPCLSWPSATPRREAIIFIIVLPGGALLGFDKYYLAAIRSFLMLLFQYLPFQ